MIMELRNAAKEAGVGWGRGGGGGARVEVGRGGSGGHEIMGVLKKN